MLGLPALVVGVAAAVVDVTVLDAEHRDVAFPVEGDVHHPLGVLGVLGVGPDAVEGAVQVRRQLALDFAVPERVLGAVHRAGDAAPGRIGSAEAAAAGLGEQHLRLGLFRRARHAARDEPRANGRAAQQRTTIHAALVLVVAHATLPDLYKGTLAQDSAKDTRRC